MSNATEARIRFYIHCKTCLDIPNKKTVEKLAIGWTKEGIQVVCENCGKNIVDLDFLGQKVSTYDPNRNKSKT